MLKIHKLTKTEDVYDLTIDDNHNFIANDILVHNCQEINLPTKPLQHIDDTEGEIALCMLGGLNLGILKGADTFHKMEKPLRLLVRSIDKLIDIQDYPVVAAMKQIGRRSIGIGVTNFAYWLAKNGLQHNSQEALELIDELFEHFQFYLIKASIELAKEEGPCQFYDRTKWSKGILPIDRANDNAKALVQRKPSLPWEALREDLKRYGIRNSALSALMPVESSSLVTNSTNGMEYPRSLVVTKLNKSGDSSIKTVVPGIKSLASKYTLAWDISDNDAINKIAATAQKWICQGQSVNHYYNPALYQGNMIPAKVVIKDLVQAWKLGIKQLYYANTLDTIADDALADCAGGGCTL